MPLRRTLLLFAALAAPIALAQTPAPATQPAAAPLPAFEVVSVKPNKVALGWRGSQMADGYSLTAIPLAILISQAYGIASYYHVAGMPSWANDARYDIEGKVGDSDVAAMQNLDFRQHFAMFQPVLADRFNLKLHWETRTEPIYSLVVVKPGVLVEMPPPANGNLAMGRRCGGGTHAGHWVTKVSTMPSLASMLSGVLGRMVVDDTGLTGYYNAGLHWTPDDLNASDSQPCGASDNSISIFTALEEQLGLKLVPSKGPVQTLVIDHVERPSEN
jgi:uncharacterized protein (TIGR03435 family)